MRMISSAKSLWQIWPVLSGNRARLLKSELLQKVCEFFAELSRRKALGLAATLGRIDGSGIETPNGLGKALHRLLIEKQSRNSVPASLQSAAFAIRYD